MLVMFVVAALILFTPILCWSIYQFFKPKPFRIPAVVLRSMMESRAFASRLAYQKTPLRDDEYKNRRALILKKYLKDLPSDYLSGYNSRLPE